MIGSLLDRIRRKRVQSCIFNRTASVTPIFIIGVLRSGTTLLRVVLDSHSKIAAPSETPWILGGYGDNSLRQLAQFLMEDKYGPVMNLKGVDSSTILQATRLFMGGLFSDFLNKQQKELVVLKTPQDIKYLEFLVQLFPDTKYIHIYRDGRDSACSLVENASSVFGSGIVGDNLELNHINAFAQWYEWETKIRRIFQNNIKYTRIRYEDLVTEPVSTLTKICNFVEVEFEQSILSYSKFDHSFPEWEAGTYDLKSKKTITDSSIGRWKNKFSSDEELYIQDNYGEFLKSLGYI